MLTLMGEINQITSNILSVLSGAPMFLWGEVEGWQSPNPSNQPSTKPITAKGQT